MPYESLPVLGNGASNATAVCAHRAEGGAPLHPKHHHHHHPHPPPPPPPPPPYLIKARVQRNAISFVSTHTARQSMSYAVSLSLPDDVDVSLLAASLLLPFAFGDNTEEEEEEEDVRREEEDVCTTMHTFG